MNYSAFHWSEKARKYAETVGTVFNVKGRVDNVNDLPSTGNKVGDLYLVGLTTDPDRTEYAWLNTDNDPHWEKLGSTATSLAFSAITGQPTDNTNLATALNAKVDEADLGTLAYADAITNGDISGTINQDKITNLTTDLGNKANDNAVVHLAGTETITGWKTFTGGVYRTTNTTDCRFVSKTSIYEQGTAPSSSMYGGYRFVDKNGIEMATCYASVDTNNTCKNMLYVKSPVTGGTATRQMGILCDSSGVFKTTAPNPTEDTTSSTQIDTVGARNTKLNTLIPTQTGQSGKFLTTNGTSTSWGTVDALPTQTGHSGSVLTTDGSSASWQGTSSCAVVIESKNPTSADPTWYRVWSDGWVEQGGIYTAASSAGTYYITLPKEMTDTNYTVVASYNQVVTSDWTANTSFNQYSTTQLKVSQRTTVAGNMSWEVKGVIASS